MVKLVFGIGDSLSVRLSAQTTDFTRGMERAGDKLSGVRNAAFGTSGALQVLQGRADEAGDEMADVGRESGQASRRLLATSTAAGATGGAFSALTTSTEGLSLSFGSLITSSTGLIAILGGVAVAAGALLSTLVPLAATIAGLTAGATALAGAFGTVIGTGIIAFGQKRGEQNKKRLEQTRERIEQLKELKKQEAGLNQTQQKELEAAQETVQQLEAKQAAQSSLTEAQEKELDQLVERRDEMLEQIRNGETLTKQKQKELKQARERIDELRSLREETTALTEAERNNLETARERIDNIREQADETRGLTKAEKEELETLKEQEKKLKDQTGVMGGLKSAMADLKEELTPIIVAFGEQFTPLVEDAINAIPQLIRNIFSAIGGMDRFANALRSAGQTAFRIIPGIVSTLFDLATRALPLVRQGAEWFIANGKSIFKGIMQTTREIGPILLNVGQTIVNLLPKINEIGKMVLKTLVPAIANFANSVSKAGPEANKLFTEIGNAIPFFSKLAGRIGNVAIPALKAFTSIMATVIGAFNRLDLGQKKLLITGLAAAIGILGGPISALGAAVVIAANHWDFFAGIIDNVINRLETLHGWLVGIWETLKPVVDLLGGVAGFINQAPDNAPQTGLPPGQAATEFGTERNIPSAPNIQVNIEGELPEDSIRSVSTRVMNEQNRRVRRNSGVSR